MAKKARKKSGKKAGKRASKKAGKKRGKKVSAAARAKVVKQRITLHLHASELPDFKGGRMPVRSGCGRPRTKKH